MITYITHVALSLCMKLFSFCLSSSRNSAWICSVACNYALQLACSLTLSFPHSCDSIGDSIERGGNCQRKKCEFDHGVQFIGLELFSDLSLGFSFFFLFFHILNMKCYKNQLSYNLKTVLQLPGNISYFDYYIFSFLQ